MLEKSTVDQGNPYVDFQIEICPIESPDKVFASRSTTGVVVFQFDFFSKM